LRTLLFAAREALDRARRFSHRALEAQAYHLLAKIAAREDPPNLLTSENHYRQALARAEAIGLRPLLAHCHLGLGALYRRSGQPLEARNHLTTATAMYREMGMRSALEQAEAEMRELA
jgi:hypothetical protein